MTQVYESQSRLTRARFLQDPKVATPVFLIQDGIKFPDLVHAVKPEPHHETPQSSTVHDTFLDFISLMPESTHMVRWLLSDRAVPRSYSMLEGFGVPTFRMVSGKGTARFRSFDPNHF